MVRYNEGSRKYAATSGKLTTLFISGGGTKEAASRRHGPRAATRSYRKRKPPVSGRL